MYKLLTPLFAVVLLVIQSFQITIADEDYVYQIQAGDVLELL